MATYFLPGESQGWGSLVGYRLWGRTESDMTEATQQQQQQQQYITVYNKELNGFTKGQHIEYENKKAEDRSFKTME